MRKINGEEYHINPYFRLCLQNPDKFFIEKKTSVAENNETFEYFYREINKNDCPILKIGNIECIIDNMHLIYYEGFTKNPIFSPAHSAIEVTLVDKNNGKQRLKIRCYYGNDKDLLHWTVKDPETGYEKKVDEEIIEFLKDHLSEHSVKNLNEVHKSLMKKQKNSIQTVTKKLLKFKTTLENKTLSLKEIKNELSECDKIEQYIHDNRQYYFFNYFEESLEALSKHKIDFLKQKSLFEQRIKTKEIEGSSSKKGETKKNSFNINQKEKVLDEEIQKIVNQVNRFSKSRDKNLICENLYEIVKLYHELYRLLPSSMEEDIILVWNRIVTCELNALDYLQRVFAEGQKSKAEALINILKKSSTLTLNIDNNFQSYNEEVFINQAAYYSAVETAISRNTKGHNEIIMFAAKELGDDLNWQHLGSSKPPVMLAYYHKNYKLLHWLIEVKKVCVLSDWFGNSLFLEVVRQNDIENAKYLFQQKVNIDVQEINSVNNDFFDNVFDTDEEQTQWDIQSRCVEDSGYTKNNALIIAVKSGFLDMAELLIQWGINVHTSNANNETALSILVAQYLKNAFILEKLSENEAYSINLVQERIKTLIESIWEQKPDLTASITTFVDNKPDSAVKTTIFDVVFNSKLQNEKLKSLFVQKEYCQKKERIDFKLNHSLLNLSIYSEKNKNLNSTREYKDNNKFVTELNL